ncbi:transposase [Sphingomonas sp. RRHST34]|uniref:Transposase n=1 Tax=Sphingomonas citri TaxID=2862499 RepID=A0ABS7BRU4_9SPHN|nr:transposase [Sphingomonas citri]
MALIARLYAITSERRLCEEVCFNLAYRWFCRLLLDARVRRGVERVFADAKSKRGLTRLRLRGQRGAEEEFLLGAAIANLVLLAHPDA